MCDIWQEEKGTYLSTRDIEHWVEEWQSMSLRAVVICGEPLLHPELWDIVDVLRAHGIAIELLSNGYLIPRHARNVVDLCEVLRISLDGPAGIHDEIRGVKRAFALVERAMQSVHRLVPDFPVDARCAVHRQNFHHIVETVLAARELGFRSISFSGTDVSNEEAFQRQGKIDHSYVAALAIRGPELDELEAELDELERRCADEFAAGFISDTPADLRRLILQHYRALEGQDSFPAVRCNAPWTSAVVGYDGSVSPCFPLRAYGEIAAGDSFEGILNSPEATGFRADLDVQTSRICETCVCQTLTA